MGFDDFICSIWTFLTVGYFVQIVECTQNRCNTSTDQECSDREFVTHLYSNPDALWDTFPCPPPWKPELILELPWKDRLGEEDGDRLCKRLASRCGLDLVKLQAVALQDSLIFSDCDIKCFIGLLIGFLLTVCLFVAMGTFLIRSCRRKKSSKKADSRKETRVFLTTTGGVQTKLIDGESSPPEKSEKWTMGFSRFWRKSNIYESNEPNGHVKDKSENESLTYSGADTSNTYSSVNASENSFSYPLSDLASRNLRFGEEIMLEFKEKYGLRNSETPSGYQTKKVSSPVSNMLYDIRSPNPSVSNAMYQSNCQCGSCFLQSPNQIPRSCPCNICSQSNSSIPFRGQFVDVRQSNVVSNAYPSSCQQCNSENVIGYCRSEHYDFEKFPYADDRINSGVQNHSLAYMDQDNASFRVNSACSCKQCVQQKMMSDEDHSTYSTGSDVYGVPKTATNYPRDIQCNCRQCTRMIPIAAYTKRLSRTEEYTRDETDMEILSAEDINPIGPEHRKRKRSKPRPPISSTASSSDNTGSEKSFRSGKLKTNGSLFNSKLINR